MIDSLTPIISNIGILLILLVAHRAGLLKLLLNGKNENGKNEIEQLQDQIATMQDNHLHTVDSKIDKLSERMIEHNTREIAILEEIRTILLRK